MKTLTYAILKSFPSTDALKANFLKFYGFHGRADIKTYFKYLCENERQIAVEFAVKFGLTAHITESYPAPVSKIKSETKIRKGKIIYFAKYDTHGRMIPEIKDKLF